MSKISSKTKLVYKVNSKLRTQNLSYSAPKKTRSYFIIIQRDDIMPENYSIGIFDRNFGEN